jgi:hypothetical protein
LLLVVLVVVLGVLGYAAPAIAAPPLNDDASNAQAISGASGGIRGSNVEATAGWGADPANHSVWYLWTAPRDGIASFDTIGSSFPTLLAATPAGDPWSTPNACEVNGTYCRVYPASGNVGSQSQIAFDAHSGENVYIEVDGAGGAAGDLFLNWHMAETITGSGALLEDPGCLGNALPRNDDDSSDQVPLGFDVNFFGQHYGSLFVNTNGNVTFDAPLPEYTPVALANTSHVMIAPYWADADTRAPLSDVARFGRTTFGGRPAFCVDWSGSGVGYFIRLDELFTQDTYLFPDRLNSFQLLLIDRSDTGPGNFDIVFNYAQVQWETGQASGGVDGLGGTTARVGFTNGNPFTPLTFELPGSGDPGYFLDSNRSTGLIYHSRGSDQLGRYVFRVRNGLAPVGKEIFGYVSGPTPQAGASVQACAGDCLSATTDATGRFSFTGLPDGTYTLEAFPPAGSSAGLGPSRPVSLQLDGSSPASIEQDLALAVPIPPPPGTTISSVNPVLGGVPILLWTQDLQLQASGCVGGTAQYTLTMAGAVTPLRNGPMVEGPAGIYTATIPKTSPDYGAARVTIVISCQSNPIAFDIYIDPSGLVVSTLGGRVRGASVTLLRSDTGLPGTFAVVPDGSAWMSPANRNNPSTTDTAGVFGWDVIAGFYEIRAARASCTAPGGAPYATTGPLEIPPPASSLRLVLDCGPPPAIAFNGNEGSYGILDTVNITCTTTDSGVGIATDPCVGFGIHGLGWSFEPGLNTLPVHGLVATDNAGDSSQPATTSFTVRVTTTSLCELTKQFIESSAKYRALTPAQKAAVDPLAEAVCQTLAEIVPSLSPAEKARLVRIVDLGIDALLRPGWVTGSQATTLKTLVNAL